MPNYAEQKPVIIKTPSGINYSAESRQKQFNEHKDAVIKYLLSQNISEEYRRFVTDSMRQIDLSPKMDNIEGGLGLMLEQFGLTKSPERKNDKINKDRRMLFLIAAGKLFPDISAKIPKTAAECEQQLKEQADTLKDKTSSGIELRGKLQIISKFSNDAELQIGLIDSYIKYVGGEILKSGNKEDIVTVAKLTYRLEIIRARLERELKEKKRGRRLPGRYHTLRRI